jgi:hypothetical protein
VSLAGRPNASLPAPALPPPPPPFLPSFCLPQRLEKLNRVKVVERERASLESAKMEAQALLGERHRRRGGWLLNGRGAVVAR